jgi:hypothetical protein
MSYVQLIPEQQINSSHQPANSSHQLINSSHQPANSSHQPTNSSHQPVNSSHQTSIHDLPVITQSLANNRIYDNIVLYPGMW